MTIWKRILTAVTAGMLCVGSVPVARTALPETEIAASAETYTYGDLTYSVLNDGRVAITDCDETVTEVEVPAEIDGIAVTLIGDEAFANCSELTSITIPDGVTYIGHNAFDSCRNLTAINIPYGVTYIGEDAFHMCRNLTDINIPNSVINIKDFAFYGCESLTAITIPGSVTSIGNQAFYHCESLTSITLSNGVTDIGREAFAKCKSLTSITIPDSVTNIRSGAFSFCTSLTSFILSDNNISYSCIDGVLFNKDQTELISYPNKKSSDYIIPDSVSTIEGFAFGGCRDLTTIILPDSVSSIGHSAFEGCTRLTSITIPNNVTSIENSAFEDCTSLTSITIPDSVTSIDNYTFYGCPSLTSITIPDSVTSIGYLAFAHCTSLTAITIPDSVTEVGSGMFYGCSELQSVTLSNQITELPAFDTVGFFQNCSSLTEITIPDNVTCIECNTFSKTALSEIIIPDSVTRIECNAFAGTALMENQTGIKYADTWVVGCDEDITTANLRLGTKGIGDNAFSNCTALTTITLPETVTNIGNDAFDACDNLKDVYYGGSDASWDKSAWRVRTDEPLLSANIYCNLTYRFLNGSATEVVSCAKDAIRVTIPEKAYSAPVTSIKEKAFEGCSALTSIIIPDSVTNIGKDAFLGCTNLTSISIGAGITSLDEIPLDLLEEIHVSPYNTAYADNDNVLYNKDFTELIRCSTKKAGEITIPDSTSSIAEGAFFGCEMMTSVIIPDSMISIKSDAFCECNALTDVYYQGTSAEWEMISIANEGNTPLLNAAIHCSDEICPGDIDNNTAVNPDDAYLCLLAYASISVGKDSGLTDAQALAADVTGDGSITPDDAYYILLYYAKKSVGLDPTWEDVLKS